jgi:cell division protein FtsN
VIAADSGPVKTAPDQPGGAANPYRGLKIYNNKAPADAHAANAPLPSIITQPGEPLFSAFGPKHPAPGKAAPAKEAPAPAPAPQKTVAQAAPKPAAAPPPPKPAPVVTRPAPVAVAKAPPPAPAAAPVSASGAYVAQIASFKSQAEADAGWAAFRRSHAATLGGMSPDIVSVDLGAKGTWFRLRTGSFPDRAAAADFCARLKAEGASCLPAKG